MPVSIEKFTFNPFSENTYVLHDETGECIIIDPGCYEAHEKIELSQFIINNNLRPVRLLNTHCHIDHVFGNKFVADTWSLTLEIHEGELPVLEALPEISRYFGIPLREPSPLPGKFIREGDFIHFGNTRLEVLFTPGHSPASVSFFCRKDQFLIAGDVLFQGSIGRTDLPGGDYDTLIASIKTQFFPLGDEVKVYAGHGADTTIGYERRRNPFLQD